MVVVPLEPSLTPTIPPTNPAAAIVDNKRSGRASSVSRWIYDKVRGDSSGPRHHSEGSRPLAPKAYLSSPPHAINLAEAAVATRQATAANLTAVSS